MPSSARKQKYPRRTSVSSVSSTTSTNTAQRFQSMKLCNSQGFDEKCSKSSISDTHDVHNSPPVSLLMLEIVKKIGVKVLISVLFLISIFGRMTQPKLQRKTTATTFLRRSHTPKKLHTKILTQLPLNETDSHTSNKSRISTSSPQLEARGGIRQELAKIASEQHPLGYSSKTRILQNETAQRGLTSEEKPRLNVTFHIGNEDKDFLLSKGSEISTSESSLRTGHGDNLQQGGKLTPPVELRVSSKENAGSDFFLVRSSAKNQVDDSSLRTASSLKTRQRQQPLVETSRETAGFDDLATSKLASSAVDGYAIAWPPGVSKRDIDDRFLPATVPGVNLQRLQKVQP